jgi:hypothetical protein
VPGAPAPGLIVSSDVGSFPPLVLRCRHHYVTAVAGAALVLLALATRLVADGGSVRVTLAVLVYAATALLIQFFLRFCLASLELSDSGFRLRGPLHHGCEIRWIDVRDWRRRRPPVGPRFVVVASVARRPVTVPLLYEDVHLLELGLHQRQFPTW